MRSLSRNWPLSEPERTLLLELKSTVSVKSIRSLGVKPLRRGWAHCLVFAGMPTMKSFGAPSFSSLLSTEVVAGTLTAYP